MIQHQPPDVVKRKHTQEKDGKKSERKNKRKNSSSSLKKNAAGCLVAKEESEEIYRHCPTELDAVFVAAAETRAR